MTRVLFLSAIIILCPTAVMAGVGQPVVNIFLAYEGAGPVCATVVPDGSGHPLTQSNIPGGGPADATVTVEVLDLTETPIVGYPGEDIWLESADGGLAFCLAGTMADGPTDALGRTTISLPLRAGGWSLAGTRVFVSGSSFTTPASLDLVFNSPDLNGDLEVNLSDVQLFAEDYYSPTYRFRSDLSFDSKVNLSDVVPLSRAYGATCP